MTPIRHGTAPLFGTTARATSSHAFAIVTCAPHSASGSPVNVALIDAGARNPADFATSLDTIRSIVAERETVVLHAATIVAVIAATLFAGLVGAAMSPVCQIGAPASFTCALRN